MVNIRYEEVHQDPNWYFEPTLEDRKMQLVGKVKLIAPDWDELSVIELLTVMAKQQITFSDDDKLYLKDNVHP